MTEQVFSPYWYKVAKLRPRFRRNVYVRRHLYRGEPWYVLEDKTGLRHQRLNANAYHWLGLLDGQRTVQQAWDLANERQGEQAPGQGQVLQMLTRLSGAQLLEGDLDPDIDGLFSQRDEQVSSRRRQRIVNPLVLPFSLYDPDRLLSRLNALFGPLLSWHGVFLWLLLVSAGVLLAAMHWQELSSVGFADLSSPQNLLLFWLLYPLVKLIHELGHGVAVKAGGGEVHDMGITILALLPVPYVDASAATAFENKWKRAAVSAAGMMVELSLAALAMMLWLVLDPGLLRTAAFDVMLIGTLSSLLFNGNPLMRFDAYYVLSDLLEIPHLWKRSRAYYLHLGKRFLFGQSDRDTHARSPSEAAWLLSYGALSYAYWLTVLLALFFISLEISSVLAAGLLLWIGVMQLGLPLWRFLKFLRNGVNNRQRRRRGLAWTLFLGGSLVTLLGVVPMPFFSDAEAVVWPPDQARVRADTDCLTAERHVAEGDWVERDQLLISCEDPFLDTEIRVLRAKLREVQAEYSGYALRQRMERSVLQEEINSLQAELELLQEHERGLQARSPESGYFVSVLGDGLIGHLVPQGEDLGYVLNRDERVLRAVIDEKDIGLFAPEQIRVQVRLAELPDRSFTGRLLRILPGAGKELPSAALGTSGGGSVELEPGDGSGRLANYGLYQMEIAIPPGDEPLRIGGRAFIRFRHADKPLVLQLYRRLRQMFFSALVV